MTKKEADLETLKMFKRINERSERLEETIEKSIKKEEKKHEVSTAVCWLYFFVCLFGTVDFLILLTERFL